MNTFHADGAEPFQTFESAAQGVLQEVVDALVAEHRSHRVQDDGVENDAEALLNQVRGFHLRQLRLWILDHEVLDPRVCEDGIEREGLLVSVQLVSLLLEEWIYISPIKAFLSQVVQVEDCWGF